MAAAMALAVSIWIWAAALGVLPASEESKLDLALAYVSLTASASIMSSLTASIAEMSV
eukprot:CAMPEP_0181267082 /NCGR_PEP_ID=MMETSP1097-20121128/4667_1 /TAXON_ID=35684 /ORGANISM="Pseudopedinella elastica, Strain CCMP716" /LENGTH=57 /DNA_ID=CAMNT_0023366399 /DNA_START=239 /DNA_END=412 /DNA_ORIENTATION=-